MHYYCYYCPTMVLSLVIIVAREINLITFYDFKPFFSNLCHFMTLEAQFYVEFYAIFPNCMPYSIIVCDILCCTKYKQSKSTNCVYCYDDSIIKIQTKTSFFLEIKLHYVYEK